MKTRMIIFCFHLLLLSLLTALPALGEEVRISAAASLNDALREIGEDFGKTHPHVSLVPNFGSSGSLAKQISQGAPADLFLAANPKWMELLVQQGRMAADTVRVCATNTLVFIGPRATQISSLSELASLQRIALGSPKSVPAGQYAEQAMRATGIYEELVLHHKLVLAKDVRQALLYADRGEVDGAFVYRTDALLAKNAVILYTVPAELHDRIVYLVGLTREGEGKTGAQNFFSHLKTPSAVTILKKYGFEATDGAPRPINMEK